MYCWLLICAAAGLPAQAGADVGSMPKEFWPEHGVAVLRGDKVIVTRYSFTLNIPTGRSIPSSTVKEFTLDEAKGFSLAGKPLSVAKLRRRLSKPTPVLLRYSTGGVEPFYQKLYRKGTTVLLIPTS